MNLSRPARFAAGALVAGLLSSACASDPTLGQAERARWENAAIDEYTLSYKINGGVGAVGPKTVRVSNGVVMDIIAEPDRLISLPDYTVDDLFDKLEASEEVIRATFDPELGYPTLLELDPIVAAIDDEVTISVVSLDVET